MLLKVYGNFFFQNPDIKTTMTLDPNICKLQKMTGREYVGEHSTKVKRCITDVRPGNTNHAQYIIPGVH